MNLINNSADAIAKDPHKWIKIEFKREENYGVFSVTDSGEKIKKHVADRLMTPLFTTKAIGKGTGLGLHISNKIAQSHKGSFYLDQDFPENKFILKIPLKQ